MVLNDITNCLELRQKSEPALLRADTKERAAVKALEQENILLRAELEKLRAAQEPRTPRRSASAAPSTPRVPLSARPARSVTPRSSRQAQADEAGSQPGTPRRSPPALPSARPEIGRPVRRSPTQPASAANFAFGKPSPPTSRATAKAKAAPNSPSGQTRSSSRAAWANAKLAQDRRNDELHVAMAAKRQAVGKQKVRQEQAMQRTAVLTKELHEAKQGQSESIDSLLSSIALAEEALEVEGLRVAKEERSSKQQSNQVEMAEEKLRAMKGELANLQEHQLWEGADQRQLVEKEEELQMAFDASRVAYEARASLMAENALLARRLNNEILSLKGNVRVFCRMRPALPDEASDALRVELREDSQAITVYSPPEMNVTGMTEKTRSWGFEFDQVFRSDTTQATVFEEISLLVQSALDGYRVAILAYGQTGSGKTHTMLGGSADEAGMIPRTVDLIFKEVEQLKQNGWEFEVHAAMAEVYNDVVFDLLAAKDGKAGEATDETTAFRRVPVRDAAGVHALLRKANRERHVAATAANERSSRSHMVFQLSLGGHCVIQGQEREVSGQLSFVDLAGSERLHSTGAVGERLKEAQHINRSLAALGDVIEAVCRKSSSRGAAATAVHVPFRNSRLTMLLRDSLGGDSKTLMFVNVSPSQEHLGETLSSLRFASKVHACSVGVARRHATDSNSAHVD